MAIAYDSTSPYFSTGLSEFFLDVMVNRAIPRQDDDLSFVINRTYQYRPDLLAFDLYQNAALWWTFYQRNPNTLTQPPLDFAIGVQIYLPKMTTLKSALGI